MLVYIDESPKSRVRFRTSDQLQGYLARSDNAEFDFSLYPIAGSPETFHYSGGDQVVTRVTDQRSFDSLEDFICYAFQCDAEGYSNTEHVDFELLS